MKKRYLLHLLWIIPLGVGFYHMIKPSPDYTSQKSELYQIDNINFLYDLTFADSNNEVKSEQEIFDTTLSIINDAEEFLMIDLFLFNDDYDHSDLSTDYPSISSDLAEALVKKKQTNPDMPIYFISDPINSFYRTYIPKHVETMLDEGIAYLETDLSVLRDSNPLYSGFYRTYGKWLTSSDRQYLPNVLRPMGPKVNIPSYLSMLNFKANHRKTVMSEKQGMIASWNPHDGSGYHSNIAFTFEGPVLQDLLKSEIAVFNEASQSNESVPTLQTEETDGQYGVQLLTEFEIKQHILQLLNQAKAEDQIKVGLFYLSDRDVIRAMKDASNRGVHVQLILDINQDAFGNEKIGIPNRPVAHELNEYQNIDIRWYRTHGEQYHSKFIYHDDGHTATIIGGSANFTRRNLDDYNLETDLLITGDRSSELFIKVNEYYDRIWTNEGGTYTTDYEEHAEDVWWKTVIYHIQEFTGLSTF